MADPLFYPKAVQATVDFWSSIGSGTALASHASELAGPETSWLDDVSVITDATQTIDALIRPVIELATIDSPALLNSAAGVTAAALQKAGAVAGLVSWAADSAKFSQAWNDPNKSDDEHLYALESYAISTGTLLLTLGAAAATAPALIGILGVSALALSVVGVVAERNSQQPGSVPIFRSVVNLTNSVGESLVSKGGAALSALGDMAAAAENAGANKLASIGQYIAAHSPEIIDGIRSVVTHPVNYLINGAGQAFSYVTQKGIDGAWFLAKVIADVVDGDPSKVKITMSSTNPESDGEIIIIANRDLTNATYTFIGQWDQLQNRDELGRALAQSLLDYARGNLPAVGDDADSVGSAHGGGGNVGDPRSPDAATRYVDVPMVQTNPDGTTSTGMVRYSAQVNRDGSLTLTNTKDGSLVTGHLEGETFKTDRIDYLAHGLDIVRDPDGYVQIRVANNPIKIDFVNAAVAIGNAFGHYIAGDDVLTQTITSATIHTLASNLGDILNAEVFGSRAAISQNVNAALIGLDHEFLANLRDAGVGALSSIMTAELINELGLHGVVGGAVGAVANSELSIIGSNLLKIAAGQNISAFKGIDALQIGNVVGSYIGTTLANDLANWDEVGEQIGASIGSALGAAAGAAIPVPVLGSAIGAFFGDLIGGLIGGLFTGKPESGAIVGFDPNAATFKVDTVWKEEGGKRRVARALGDNAASTLNGIVKSVGGELINGASVEAGSYGMRGARFTYWEDGTESSNRVKFDTAGDLISYGTMKAAREFEFLGGDLYAKRAFYATLAGGTVNSTIGETGFDPDQPGSSQVLDNQDITHVDYGLDVLLGNLVVASRLKTYLASREAIDGLIAAEPNSAFSADWLLVLSRAVELGLLKRNSHDFDGGFSYLVNKAGVDATDVGFAFQKYDSGGGERITFLGGSLLHDAVDSASKTIVTGSAAGDVLTATLGGTRSDNLSPSDPSHISDVFRGGAGDDEIFGGDTGDDLFGDEGDDILVGGKLDDWLYGGAGDDVLDAGGGNGNVLSGGAGSDYLLGADWAATATREDGSDWLSGGTGNDVITGRGGNDYIEGGQGRDKIDGGAGSDTIIFRQGDGTDALTDTGTAATDHDVLDFDQTVAVGSLTVVAHSAGADLSLLINGAASGDRVDLRGAVTNLNEGLEEYRFTESSWSKTDLTSDVLLAKLAGTILNGTSADETISGTIYDDTLSGGGGHDVLSGGEGSDTYLFSLGDGVVSIDDIGAAVDLDVVQFGVGIGLDDLSVSVDPASPRDLIVKVGAGGDALILRHQDVADGASSIEELRFADGTSLTLRDLEDMGTGSAFAGRVADAAPTGSWSQDLSGTDSNETYSYNPGDGDVRISETLWSPGDALVFGAGINSADVVVTRDPADTRDVWIRFANQTGSVLLNDQNNGYNSGVEEIRFADGTVWDRAAIDQKVVDRAASAGDDRIFDSYSSTTISAGAGNDYVEAGDGFDTIIGGTGDDSLNGGGGSDTYVYDIGDGNDRIVESLWSAGDVISFGAGIAAGDVVITRDVLDARNIRVSFINHAGSILIDDQDSGYSSGIEELHFADGTLWDRDAINTHIVDQASLAGKDIIRNGYGAVTITAGAGDDYIEAGDGADTIIGGQGDDDLNGGDGSDTYVYKVGDGNDRITESLWSGGDAISFGAGITTGDVVVTRDVLDPRNVRISFTDHAGSILIEEQYNYYNWGVEEVRFADGTVWHRDDIDTHIVDQGSSAGKDIIRGNGAITINAGAGDDYIEAGDGAESIIGGQGDDDLNGGDGSDTYVYNVGDGNDRITENLWSGGDAISFGAGITTGDVIVARDVLDPRNVRISFTDHAGSILIEEQYNYYNSGIEEFRFADGTVWNRDDINMQVVDQASSAGKDIIRGNGAVTINAGAGDDYIEAGDGANTIIGGSGDDDLNGADGDDIYVYNIGDGNDRITESLWSGGDALSFGAGISASDLILTRDVLDTRNVRISFTDHAGSILLEEQTDYFNLGIEQLRFADGTVWDRAQINASVAARAPDLVGTSEANQLVGTAGIDQIYGASGNDILTGGLGDDFLNGGDDNDAYVYHLGDGSDTILDDAGSSDTLRFGAGISSSDLILSAATVDYNNLGLVIGIAGTDDRITIRNQNVSGANTIERFEFADGTVLTAADLRAQLMTAVVSGGADKVYGTSWADTVDGGAGEDEINTNDGDDTLTGGLGNDVLDGGAGDDAYVYNLGDGSDTILDDAGSSDTLRFGAGISSSDIILSAATVDYNNLGLVIGIAGTDDRITIRNQNVSGANTIERFEFADGTVLTDADLRAQLMTSVVSGGDDKVYGTSWADMVNGGSGADEINTNDGDDTLTGGLGNDLLNGGAGNDVYVYNLGDGSDTIFDDAGTSDTLRFGAGISSSDLILSAATVDYNNLGLVIGIAGTEDRITIRDQNWGGGHTIERFEFADGTVLTDADLRAQLMTSVVSGGDDKVYGTSWAETVNGGGGDDEIGTNDGDDTLAGGKGNDVLDGGAGNDTYVFNRGDGADTITDGAGNDTLQFAEGIDESDVSVSRALVDGDTSGVVLTVKGTGDSVYLRSEFDGNHIETISFMSGATWNVATLLQLLGNTVIDGSPLPVTMGDDTIVGASGDDVLSGLKGDDVLRGGTGSDVYHFSRGDGHDTIYDPTDDGASDTLVLEGFNPVDVKVMVSPTDPDDLILYIDDESVIYLDQQYVSGSSGIEQVQFADGTIWSRSMLAAYAANGQGTDGDDTLIGTNFSDTLKGGLGNDTLIGSAGNDTYLYASGDGDDTIVDDNGAGDDPSKLGDPANFDTLSLGEGITVASLVLTQPVANGPLVVSFSDQAGSITLQGLDPGCRSGVELIRFSDGSSVTLDALRAATIDAAATPGNDLVRGFATADSLDGGAGDDTLIGGWGGDTYRFEIGGGADTIIETADGSTNRLVFGAGIAWGNVRLRRSAAAPDDLILDLPNGSDSVTLKNQFANGGSAALQEIHFDDGTVWQAADLAAIELAQPATADADYLVGDGGANTIDGLGGADTILGGAGNDTLDGSDGNDSLYGGAGDDALHGGAGDDTLSGDTGTDSLDGGDGFDIADYSFSLDRWAIDLAAGTATIVTNGAAGQVETLTSIEGVIGGLGSDTISGDGNANRIQGSGGNDTLHGGGGDDVFVVDGDEDGVDSIDGGSGEDRIDAASDATAIGLSSVVGIEQISAAGHAGVIIATTDEADNLDLSGVVLSGIASIELGGGNDTITGSLGADVIDAGDGDDVIRYVGASTGGDQADGGAGTDTITAGADGTVIRLTSVQNVEAITGGGYSGVVLARTDASETTDLTQLPVSGIARFDLAGGADTFIGSSGADVVRGEAGDDSLSGGDGDDVFEYVGTDNGHDAVNGGAGTDTLSAGADGAVIGIGSFSGIEAVSGAGFDDVVLEFTDQNDTIDMSGLAVSGLAGIRGGAGNDLLRFGAGSQTYLYASGDGNDEIDDESASPDTDVLKLTDLNPDDVTLTRDGDHATLMVNSTGETIKLDWQFYHQSTEHWGVEQIVFANGTSWDRARIAQEALILGTAGNDQITLPTDAFAVLPGLGDDALSVEGDGSGTIHFRAGDGHDTLTNTGAGGYDRDDTLALDDVLPADVILTRTGVGLVVSIVSTGATFTIPNHFWGDTRNQREGVSFITFADGTSWDRDRIRQEAPAPEGLDATEGDDVLTGTAVADTINPLGGNDIVIGRSGDDLIFESAGDDTYVWNLGDGDDVIRGSAWWDGWNTVELGAGIAPEDLRFAYGNDSWGMVISVDGQPGSILLEDFIADHGDAGIDQLRFADGTVWTRIQMLQALYDQAATEGDDVLRFAHIDDLTIDARGGNDTIYGGDGRDRVIGGAGDDLIFESAGDDTYVWNLGDGDDVIRGSAWWDGWNTVELGAGIAPEDLRFAYGNDSWGMVISVDGQPGSILLEDFIADHGDAGIDQLRFADGTVWTRIQMLQALYDQAATEGDDVLRFAHIDDLTIDARGGNDTIYGGDGRDRVIGGAGDDLIFESAGDDTYVWNLGDGDDVIRGSAWWDGWNTVELGAGIAPEDLRFAYGNDSWGMVISVDGQPGSILLEDFIADHGDAGIDQLRFADGTVWTRIQMLQALYDQAATEGDDVLRFAHIDDLTIDARGGNDTIYGGDGRDRVIGGAGDDLIFESAGDDTYVWNLGDGDDVIRGSAWWDGWNTVELGAGIAPEDLRFAYGNDSWGMVISVDGQPGSILLEDFIADHGDAGIDQLRFADGTVWTRIQMLQALYDQAATEGDDVLRFAHIDDLTIDARGGNDTIYGGDGRDRVIGGAGDNLIFESWGNDTYVWNRGDGVDTIRNFGWWDGYDTVELGAGIAPDDLIIWYEVSDIHIGVNGEAGSVVLENQRYIGDGIDRILFADGSAWDRTTFLAHAIAATSENDSLIGTSAADTLRGLGGDDTISGLAGNDQLSGDAGNDLLDGGVGDDALIGGDGDDTLYGDGYVASGSNLIINGSFEELGSNLDYQPWGIWSTDIPGWTKTNTGRYNQVNSGNNGTLATDGQFLMDLDDAGGPGSNMDIRQTIGDRTAGEKLVLSFDHGNPLNSSSGCFQVYWNGDLIATINDLGTSTQATQILLTAGAGDNELRFQGLGTEDGMGAQIDNVQLFETLPATAGEDIVTGGAGNDYLDGGLGSDTAIFAGVSTDYSVVTSNGVVTVTDNQPTIDGDDGTDTLIGIESLEFADGTTSLAAPIVLDLDGNGVKLISAGASRTQFDWNGDGLKDASGWIGKGDGLLFLDRDGDGLPGDAKELSFIEDKPGAKSDLDGLSAFDSNRDGILSDLDDRFDAFNVWVDRNGDGVAGHGEVLTLAQAGVASINLSGDPTHRTWNWGDNVVINKGTFTRTNGLQGALADVAISYTASSPEKIVARMTGPLPLGGWQQVAASRLAEAMASQVADKGTSSWDFHHDWTERRESAATMAAHATW